MLEGWQSLTEKKRANYFSPLFVVLVTPVLLFLVKPSDVQTRFLGRRSPPAFTNRV